MIRRGRRANVNERMAFGMVNRTTQNPARIAWVLAALGLALAPAAWAHDGTGVAGGFIAGVMHPIGGIDHLLAMVAVGMWGAFLGAPLIWQLPVAFPLLMVVGGVLGIAGVVLPGVEAGIALSVAVLGAAIAAGWRAPRAIALAGLWMLLGRPGAG
jgi:urease accessory protein